MPLSSSAFQPALIAVSASAPSPEGVRLGGACSMVIMSALVKIQLVIMSALVKIHLVIMSALIKIQLVIECSDTILLVPLTPPQRGEYVQGPPLPPRPPEKMWIFPHTSPNFANAPVCSCGAQT